MRRLDRLLTMETAEDLRKRAAAFRRASSSCRRRNWYLETMADAYDREANDLDRQLQGNKPSFPRVPASE